MDPISNASGTPTSSGRDNWSLRYIRLQDAYDVRVRKALKQALEAVDVALKALEGQGGIGARVQRAQALGARASLLEAMDQLFFKLGVVIKEGHQDAAEQAVKAFLNDESEILRILFPDRKERDIFRDAQIQKARRNVQSMMTRVLKTDRSLSQRLYRSKALAKGQISRVINAHLARGSGAQEMAKDLRQFVSPSAPGGASYVAQRLARTEINNAFHAQSIQDVQDRPWCDQVHWYLSKSHPNRVAPDLCDQYAQTGLFPAESVPQKPHPGCLCYFVPELMDIETFETLLISGQFQGWKEMNA